MGNLIMIKKLLQAFQQFKQHGMACQTPGLSSWSTKRGRKPSSHDVAIQTDIHTPSKSVEDYFLASNNALQRLVATMARYGRNYPVCGFALGNEHLLCCWSFCQMVFKQYCWWEIYSQFVVV